MAAAVVAIGCGGTVEGDEAESEPESASTSVTTVAPPAGDDDQVAATIKIEASTDASPDPSSDGDGDGDGDSATSEPESTVTDDQVEETGDGYLGPVRQVLDDTSGIWLTVPEAWLEVASGASPDRWIVVAPDLDALNTTWQADGVSLRVADVDPGTAWSGEREPDEPAWQDCSLVSSDDYDDGVHRGTLTWFDGCGESETEAAVLLATIADESLEIVLEMQLVSGDRSLVELVLASFEV